MTRPYEYNMLPTSCETREVDCTVVYKMYRSLMTEQYMFNIVSGANKNILGNENWRCCSKVDQIKNNNQQRHYVYLLLTIIVLFYKGLYFSFYAGSLCFCLFPIPRGHYTLSSNSCLSIYSQENFFPVSEDLMQQLTNSSLFRLYIN